MKMPLTLCSVLLLAVQLLVSAADGDDARKVEVRALTDRIKYETGKITLRDGIATISLPEGYRYLDPASSETLLTGIWGNPPSNGTVLGVVVPPKFDPLSRDSWCVVLDYQEDGYIKDHDAETINYDKLLKQMQASARESSAARVKNGYPPIELVGWAAAPRYDKASHKFYWAKEIKFGTGGEENTLNYNVRVLGRRGLLVLNAVSGMSQLAQIESATPQLLGMVEFNEGHRYSDYNASTDKLATYGLAALVAGGIAAKTGLLKGLFVAIIALKKFIILGIIALVALVRRIFGGRSQRIS